MVVMEEWGLGKVCEEDGGPCHGRAELARQGSQEKGGQRGEEGEGRGGSVVRALAREVLWD